MGVIINLLGETEKMVQVGAHPSRAVTGRGLIPDKRRGH